MGAESFINNIRKEVDKILKNEMMGFELATVTSTTPELIILIDNMKVQLTERDLIICESLLKNTKTASLKSRPGTKKQLGQDTVTETNQISKESGILSAATDTVSEHCHTLEGFNLYGSSIDICFAELKFEDILKNGDRLLVQAVTGGQKYIVIDRVVE